MGHEHQLALPHLAPTAGVPVPQFGEIRGGEAFDLLQLLNTGHSGSLSTVHATSAKQGLSRFTSCVLQSGVDLPYRAIKNNVGDSVNVVVHLERRPGRRFVSEVVEIHGYDPDRDEYNTGSFSTATRNCYESSRERQGVGPLPFGIYSG
jgi:Flp pilus assembly CpaF family ATPase